MDQSNKELVVYDDASGVSGLGAYFHKWNNSPTALSMEDQPDELER